MNKLHYIGAVPTDTLRGNLWEWVLLDINLGMGNENPTLLINQIQSAFAFFYISNSISSQHFSFDLKSSKLFYTFHPPII